MWCSRDTVYSHKFSVARVSRLFRFLCGLFLKNLVLLQLCGRTIRVDHVENYRLPKNLQEKEVQQQSNGDPTQAGQAYQGQELANKYSLQKGQDLFAPPQDDSDDEAKKEAKRMRKEERQRKRDEKEKRKREKERRRSDKEERKREKRARKLQSKKDRHDDDDERLRHSRKRRYDSDDSSH